MPLMFVLIPYFTDRQRVMRLPVITIGVMGLCLVGLLLTWGAQIRAESRFQAAYYDAVELAWGQQSLDTDRMVALCAGIGDPNCLDTHLDLPDWAGGSEITQLFDELLSGAGLEDAEPDPVQQERFDKAVAEAWEAYNAQPFVRLGLSPEGFKPHSLVTHAFLHGGWMHLLGNLLFLWLAMSSIEHVWNRGFLAGFYLAGGAAAGAFQLAFMGEVPLVPLVGASGAVAAMMGAYLVLFARSRIKLLYLFWLFLSVRTGTFFAPAWLALPMWLLWQVFLWGMAMGDQVAYGAHVGGFAFGAAVALVVMKLEPPWLLAPTSEETSIGAPMGREVRPADAKLRTDLVLAGRDKHRARIDASPAPSAPAPVTPEPVKPAPPPVVAPPPPSPDQQVEVRLAKLTRIADDHLGFEDVKGTPFRLPLPEVRWWAVGRLAYRDAEGQTHESMVCDLIHGAGRAPGGALTVQVVRLLSDSQPYAILLRRTKDTRAANFEQLMARVGKRLGGAAYAIRPPPTTLADVLRFDHVDAFERTWLKRVQEEA